VVVMMVVGGRSGGPWWAYVGDGSGVMDVVLVVLHCIVFIFIQVISIAHLQVHYYVEALPTQHGYCVEVSRRSATRKYK